MNNLSKDSFNSEIFGMDMANISYTDVNNLKETLSQDDVNNFKHLSVKVNCKDLDVCNYLLANGFYIVDTLVSYVFDYEKKNFPNYFYSDDIRINSIQERDIEKISKIAHDSFFNDRFHNDPNLDDELCNVYYENWIRNSCHGFADMVLVGKDENGNILGFGTGKYYGKDHSALVLNAVTELARGKGVYTAMIFEAMKYFKDKSRYLTLGTQINNYAVQKAWSKLGFKIYESKYVLHKFIG